MKLQLVLARFREDVSWLQTSECIYDYVIYNKGDYIRNAIPIPEKGREAYSYLQHIVRNYNYMAEHTAFIQGDPFPHCSDLYQRLAVCKGFDYCPLGSIAEEPNVNEVKKFYDTLFIGDDTIVKFSAGEQFVASRAAIQYRPHDFYKKLLYSYDFLTNELQDHYSGIIERLWMTIFDPKIPLREIN